MNRRACAVALLACAPAWAAAQGGDPLRSPECQAARAELDRLLLQRKPADAALEQARREVGRTCLGPAGSDGEARQRSGAPQPPQVAPPTIGAAPQPVQPPPIAPAPPAVPVPRPTTITTCDPGGCWDSEGRRLNQMGPFLVGPGGACTAAGGVVHCP